MDTILIGIESLVRLDLAVAALLGGLVFLLWRRLLPILVLLAIGFFAWRLNLQQHFEQAPPLALLTGAIVICLAILQATVVLLFGPQAANGAIGYLVATLVMTILKMPVVLAGYALRGAWRLLRGKSGQATRPSKSNGSSN